MLCYPWCGGILSTGWYGIRVAVATLGADPAGAGAPGIGVPNGEDFPRTLLLKWLKQATKIRAEPI